MSSTGAPATKKLKIDSSSSSSSSASPSASPLANSDITPSPIPTSSKRLVSFINKSKDKISKEPVVEEIKGPLVWIDCEMTGLEVLKDDHIIEICCIITDGDLNIIDKDGYESTVYYPVSVLDNMNQWCIEQHGKSGLTEKVLANPQRTLEKVEKELYDYIIKYIPKTRTGLLAGNSIHMDKFFMMKEFPKVIEHLHYRVMDVSTIMEFGFRHNPKLMKVAPKKETLHTARSDILESINQLKWYKENYFKSEEDVNQIIEAHRKKMEQIRAEEELKAEQILNNISNRSAENLKDEKKVDNM
ncbi:oligoribonuclease mitochondrial precursor [Scheffersomyces amazonensis]|uniref:oligoribonuclease mitochondrial precursor n=1 Tax=Scheffersomyces amazonensis TaxID=1078765 RepID=UPI00315D73E1